MPNTAGAWKADRVVPMLDAASDLCLIGLGGLNTCIPPAEISGYGMFYSIRVAS